MTNAIRTTATKATPKSNVKGSAEAIPGIMSTSIRKKPSSMAAATKTAKTTKKVAARKPASKAASSKSAKTVKKPASKKAATKRASASATRGHIVKKPAMKK